MSRLPLFFLLVCFSSASCITSYHKQQVHFIDTVQCAEDPSQHYCIYIPDSLSKKEKYPILFLLDPGGEADTAVLKYQHLAEKYKIILASSYQVKNGAYTENYNALNSMIQDVLSNYPIDESAQLMAGFSGGSRIAYVYASRATKIRGVIASGAYFPGNSNDFMPPRFNYSAIVGSYDFNFAEGLNMHNLMLQKNRPFQFVVFKGEHAWPPEIILERSLAYQLSLIPEYTRYKYDFLDFERKALEQSTSAGDLLNARWAMENIKLVDNQIQTAYQLLTGSQKYKEKVIDFERSFMLEDSLKKNIVEGVRGILLKGTEAEHKITKNLQWWKTQIESINDLSTDEEHVYTANAAHRALAHIGIILWEVNRKVIQDKHFDQALETAQVLVEAYPDNQTYRALEAESLLAIGENEEAKLVYLKALELGFKENNKYLKFSPYIKQLSSLSKKTVLKAK